MAEDKNATSKKVSSYCMYPDSAKLQTQRDEKST